MFAMSSIDPDALRKAMDVANVTPTQLAATVGVSLTYIGDIRTGRRTLARNPKLRSDIAHALDVPPHWIERPATTEGSAA